MMPGISDKNTDHGDFDLEGFLPYLLNQAAEATSRSFQAIYRSEYGMTRTQWRVLANLGKFGAMTAHNICTVSHIEKTKVSRAVAALEAEAILSRQINPQDRRAEILTLTDHGAAVFRDLGDRAITFDQALRLQLGPEIASTLDALLRQLVSLGDNSAASDGD
jgi:DNA-binding MarR family transcriptional regulator